MRFTFYMRHWMWFFSHSYDEHIFTCIKITECFIPLSTGCLWLRWAQAVQQSAWEQTVWWRGSRSSSGLDRPPRNTDGNYRRNTDTQFMLSDIQCTEQGKQLFHWMMTNLLFFCDASFYWKNTTPQRCQRQHHCKHITSSRWDYFHTEFCRFGTFFTCT